MTDYILTAIVAMTALNSMVTARYNIEHRRLKIADYGTRVAVWAGFSAVLALALWLTLAVVTGCGQFAAIIAVPLLITIGSTVSQPKDRRARETETKGSAVA